MYNTVVDKYLCASQATETLSIYKLALYAKFETKNVDLKVVFQSWKLNQVGCVLMCWPRCYEVYGQSTLTIMFYWYQSKPNYSVNKS